MSEVRLSSGTTPGAGMLLSPREEARLFWRLRRRIVWASVRQWLQQSRLRLSVLVVLCALFWTALFVSFAEGFILLESAITHVPTRAMTVQAVFNVFFVALLAMLTVSSAVIFYSTAFRHEEVRRLLTMPASPHRIVLYKFQETTVFAGWGFLLLGSPMLIAYGLVAQAPWYYYVMLAPFMVSFVCLPAAVGTIACLLLVYWLPSIRLYGMAVGIGAGAAALAALAWALLAAQSENVMTPQWLDQMLARLQYAEQRLLPSWWLSSGLLEAAHGGRPGAANAWRESVLFLGVLTSNAMLLVLLVAAAAERFYRGAYSRLQGVAAAQRKTQTALSDRAAGVLLLLLPRSMRLLVAKDLKLFRRDPIQWSQFLIFFGLLALYFVNIRRFQYGETLASWMNLIGFLNLGVVGLILSTFTTRFIFPMISLEGRRFWILGTLPVSRDCILWSKFLFACGGSVPPCALLILLSDTVLGIARSQPWIALIHQIVCWTLCIGLSSIAVGLGARLPNLREPSPSKIAAGFGGTLNLVISTLFIIVVVTSTSVPSYALLQSSHGPSAAGWWEWGGIGPVVAGVAISLAVGALVTVVPLKIGFRAFRRLEF